MRGVILLLVCISLADANNCGDGFILHNGACYFFSHDTEYYESAYITCKMFLGQSWLKSRTGPKIPTLEVSPDIVRATQYYIGASDKLIEGQWRWQTSNKLFADTYSNWRHGEPNNLQADQSCAVLDIDGWFDIHCEDKYHYICKAISFTEPLIG